jgi:hypothetical protein
VLGFFGTESKVTSSQLGDLACRSEFRHWDIGYSPAYEDERYGERRSRQELADDRLDIRRRVDEVVVVEDEGGRDAAGEDRELGDEGRQDGVSLLAAGRRGGEAVERLRTEVRVDLTAGRDQVVEERDPGRVRGL